MTDSENSLIAALHESTKAQTELARQIKHQSMAIQALADAIADSSEAEYEDEDDPMAVMNPRHD